MPIAINLKCLEILNYLFEINENPTETLYMILKEDDLEMFKLYQKRFGVSLSGNVYIGTKIYKYLYQK